MVTRIIRVVTCCKELLSINSHDSSLRWTCEVTRKSNTLYLHLQKTHGHHTRWSVDLQWEASIFKYIYNFLITWTKWDHLTIWKTYIFSITWPMVCKPGRVLTYGRRFSVQALKSWPTSWYIYVKSLSRDSKLH